MKPLIFVAIAADQGSVSLSWIPRRPTEGRHISKRWVPPTLFEVRPLYFFASMSCRSSATACCSERSPSRRVYFAADAWLPLGETVGQNDGIFTAALLCRSVELPTSTTDSAGTYYNFTDSSFREACVFEVPSSIAIQNAALVRPERAVTAWEIRSESNASSQVGQNAAVVRPVAHVGQNASAIRPVAQVGQHAAAIRRWAQVVQNAAVSPAGRNETVAKTSIDAIRMIHIHIGHSSRIAIQRALGSAKHPYDSAGAE